ncbi:MAG: hypothetical protein FJX30_00935 [Alphaproteobacteria bacterium]|nr:hypothetical protein [Alphaproteobacteria bacterium]
MSQLLNKVQKIQNSENKYTKELSEILEILDAIENHTAELRKKILSEVATDKNNLHLQLDKIEE